MAGFSTYAEDEVLDHAFGGLTWAAPANTYIQLHTADPTDAGTTAVAGNDTRKPVSWGAASAGSISNDTAINWTTGEVDTNETYTHFSIWDATPTGGNCIGTGDINPDSVVTAGNAYEIGIGNLTFTLD